MSTPLILLRTRRDQYARLAGRELAREDTSHRAAQEAFIGASQAYERDDRSAEGKRLEMEGDVHAALSRAAEDLHLDLHGRARKLQVTLESFSARP